MSENKPPEYPNPTYGWYVVCVLTLAYVFSFLDRQILALLIEPIRKDMDISDTQISLLLGLAFSIFYTLLGVPIGRLADRKSRRGIIAVGITIWCIMTAACGLAKTFTQLFLARVGVGIGEASLNPSALSLISDYFPRNKRARPIGFYNMGVSLGAGVAMVIGGQIIAWVFEAPPIELPVVGTLQPWQAVFVMVGLPGLLIALLMATVKEPVRHDKITTADGQPDFLPMKDVMRFLLDRKATYLSLFLGMSVVTIVGYGFLFWIPTMFIRTWGWSIAEVSMAYGLVVLVFGPIGVNLGGWLAQRLYQRGRRAGHMRVTILNSIYSRTFSNIGAINADTGIGFAIAGVCHHWRRHTLCYCGRRTNDDCAQPNARTNSGYVLLCDQYIGAHNRLIRHCDDDRLCV